MTDIQAVGHIRFEGGRFVIDVEGTPLEDAGLSKGATVFVRIESIEVTA